MNCEKCGRPSKVSPCWKCKQDEVRELGYSLGYQAGYLKGVEEGKAESPLRLTVERWRQLVQLCHPQKHGDSPTSTDVTRWLLSIKPDS